MVNAWEYLHNITHVDHKFQNVDNHFVCPENVNDVWQLDTNVYQQSIQMFAFLPIGMISY